MLITKNKNTQNLSSYINKVYNIPNISFIEEQKLAKNFKNKKDLISAQKLITSHLKYVVKIARNYTGYNILLSDLIQEGTYGLIKALKKFQPNKKIKLISFAIHWIKAEINEYIIKNLKIVKIATTKTQRKLFFNIRKIKNKLDYFTDKEINLLSKNLNINPKEIINIEQRIYNKDINIDIQNFDHEKIITKYYDPFKEIEKQIWYNYIKKELYIEFEKLNTRNKKIIYYRWLSKKKISLQKLAIKFNITAERVRQIEKNTINKLKNKFKNM